MRHRFRPTRALALVVAISAATATPALAGTLNARRGLAVGPQHFVLTGTLKSVNEKTDRLVVDVGKKTYTIVTSSQTAVTIAGKRSALDKLKTASRVKVSGNKIGTIDVALDVVVV